jgi:ABC-type uncharacterized transport system substrate-binding protein
MPCPEPSGEAMRRREFITLLSVTATWPLAAFAQQTAIPVVGYLSANSPEGGKSRVAAFRRGLQEAGYVEGQNVTVEYHWAEEQADRLPAMAPDLVKRHVTVIATGTTPAVLAAQAATTTIPIVFEMGSDPVRLGLVVNLNRPGGNITGVTNLVVEVAPKRLELLHELLPAVKVMALLVNSADRNLAQAQLREVLSGARNLGLELHVLNAANEGDFDGRARDRRGYGLYCRRQEAGRPDASPRCACNLSLSRLSCGWRSDELRIGRFGQLPIGRRLYRQGSQGRKSCRTASHPGNQV